MFSNGISTPFNHHEREGRGSFVRGRQRKHPNFVPVLRGEKLIVKIARSRHVSDKELGGRIHETYNREIFTPEHYKPTDVLY